MGLYGLAAASGPALAPVISGYAVVANGWRWAFWIMLWLSGFSLALLAFTMPEVSRLHPAARQESSSDSRVPQRVELTIDLIREYPLQTCSPTKETNRKR
jgi:MFS family permease